MVEPLGRLEGGEGALGDAVQRLERALKGLEAVLNDAPTTAKEGAAPYEAEVVEIELARGRERELEAAGAQASLALGRAMDAVR